MQSPCGERKPVAVGRFPKSFALSLAGSQGEPARAGRREIHVHLLAKSDADGENILADLRGGLNLHPLPAQAAEETIPRRPCPADGPLASGDVIELCR